jgi:simple sugar transport system permease protein
MSDLAFLADETFWRVTLAGAVRLATPIALAALGETIAERSGLLNLSVDATMTAGALVAVIAAAVGGWPAGLAAAGLAGLALGLAFAALTLVGRLNPIVAGVALSLVAYGLADGAFKLWQPSGQVAPFVALAPTFVVPGLARLPVIGEALFAQSALTYAALALAALTALALRTTRIGLALTAAGADSASAALRGVEVARVRRLAAAFGGTLAGLAGAAITVGYLGAFTEGVSAGRGYVAIAVVIIGRWSVGGALAGALLFAFCESASLRLQSRFVGWPGEVFALAPYLVTLAVLTLSSRRGAAPRELGRDVGP